MALLTKLAARTLIQQLADDPVAKFWSTANIDTLAEAALDELWGDLLEQFPWLRSVESAALTPSSPGFVNLDTALVRFYRLQNVVRGGTRYDSADARDVLVSNNVVVQASQLTYTTLGNQLHLFPYSLSADVFIRYSSRPTNFTALTDSDPVTWPDGYHLAYCYDIASRMMEKGDRKNSTILGKRSEASLYRLKAYLRKQELGGIMPWMHQSPLEWGGT